MTPAKEEEKLRVLLWWKHGCPLAYLYGDDGELQCSKCMLDFKRMSAIEIEERWVEQELKKYMELTMTPKKRRNDTREYSTQEYNKEG